MIFRLQPAQPFCFPLGCTDNIGTPATQPDSGVTRRSDSLSRFPALGAVLGAALQSVSKFCCSHCKELMLQEGGGQRNFICCRRVGRNVIPAGTWVFSPRVGLTQSNALFLKKYYYLSTFCSRTNLLQFQHLFFLHCPPIVNCP